MGRCASAPVAEVGHRHVDNATVESLVAAAAGDHRPAIPAYKDLAAYEGDGDYKLLRACLADERTPEELIEILSNASLRGLGGAGFPTGKKWQLVRGFAGPRLTPIHPAEGDPATLTARPYTLIAPTPVRAGGVHAAWADSCTPR